MMSRAPWRTPSRLKLARYYSSLIRGLVLMGRSEKKVIPGLDSLWNLEALL